MSPKQKQDKSKTPEFLKQLEKENKFDINEYLRSVFGREPYVNNAKRRWRFLISFSKFVYQRKEVDFVTTVRWFARNGKRFCKCDRGWYSLYVPYLLRG